VPRPDVGASVAAGSVLVVEKGTRGRFVAGARRMPGSPSNTTTREDVGYEMTHEFAHGVVERAMEADPSVLTRYGDAVGWLGNLPYDIGRAEAQAALAAKRVPPESAVLTAKNWEKADVVEQPMAEYMPVDSGSALLDLLERLRRASIARDAGRLAELYAWDAVHEFRSPRRAGPRASRGVPRSPSSLPPCIAACRFSTPSTGRSHRVPDDRRAPGEGHNARGRAGSARR
jgi:hypothetical protein